jgi:hypothetical protein
MKKTILLIILGLFYFQSNAQLFIDDGANGSLYITNSSGGTLGSSESSSDAISLYIDGDIIIEGAFVNDSSEVQFSGNFTNTGTFSTTGDEVFSGGDTQVVAGTYINSNDFNNLIVNKTVGTFVLLDANIEIDTTGILNLSQGLIKTQSANYIHIKNTDTSAILNAGTNGALDKFIEGNIRRNIIAGNTYTFPIGGSHIDSDGGDGIQYTAIKSNNGNGIIAVSFNDSLGNGVLDSMIICSTGIGDHQDAEYRIGNGSWEITNPSGGILNYDVTLTPTDFTDNGYVDYTIIQNGLPTGRDKCDGIVSSIPITHDSLTSFAVFEIAASTNTSLLPIKLISFNASKINNKNVLLNWQTASEINNDYFTIERSIDLISWEKLINIKGAKNSSATLSYQTIDEKPYVGNSYYRLKQTDINGQYSYSQIRNIFIEDLNISTISIYPNPATHQITIKSTANEKLEQFSIYNILGEEIAINSRIIEKDDVKVILNLSNLTTGIYFIKTATSVNKIYKY